MLHTLQTGGAIESPIRNVSRVGPLPCRELAAAAPLFCYVIIACFVSDIDDLNLTFGANTRSDVVDKTAWLDALADKKNFLVVTN